MKNCHDRDYIPNWHWHIHCTVHKVHHWRSLVLLQDIYQRRYSGFPRTHCTTSHDQITFLLLCTENYHFCMKKSLLKLNWVLVIKSLPQQFTRGGGWGKEGWRGAKNTRKIGWRGKKCLHLHLNMIQAHAALVNHIENPSKQMHCGTTWASSMDDQVFWVKYGIGFAWYLMFDRK